VVDAVSQSCDVFFYQVGQKLGVDRLAWYAKACGLGSPTGIQLDHEASGLIPTSGWKKKRFGFQWQKGETLSVAIGQGYNLATPIQMLVLTAAVANGGIRKKPLLFRSIETVEGEVLKTPVKENLGVLPVSKKTLEVVKKGLWEVVNKRQGTAWIAHVDGLDICGKTGTAQIVSRKRENPKTDEELEDTMKPHAWFVAYAPADNAKIAVAVIVEHGEHGSSAGGPVAREMIKTYLGKSVLKKKKSIIN
jgi:penicillin-binding protein 2